MTSSNQKNKLDWVDYILIIIFIGLVIAAVMQFPTLTIRDKYVYYSPCHCYSMSRKDFEEIKEAINVLILEGVPDTTSLIHILLTEGPERYYGAYFHSLAAEEEACGFCDDHTRTVYQILKAAYEFAQEGRNSTARDYLKQAEIIWKSP